jgi:hypothetical protein
MSNKENPSEEPPTLSNVLPKYRLVPNAPLYDGIGKAHPPNDWAAAEGAIVSIMALMPCPWCESEVKENEDKDFIGTCVNNPSHIMEWLPWPG